jgi:aminoglycoside 3-N-acetyltransferase
MGYFEIKQIVKRFLPSRAVHAIRQMKANLRSARLTRVPTLDENQFRDILARDLCIAEGDVVFVHSSTDGLRLQFPAPRLLPMLLDLVGRGGTLLFPSYPRLGSYEFLMSGEVFDVRKTPSYMGLITEMARRHKGAIRSFHPTKAVVAIGRYAKEVTASHQLCHYPYDRESPYGKIRDYGAKIVGIGVSTSRLSCVHCVDDEMKEDFPVCPYHERLFGANCIDYDGNTRIVETYAHNMRKIKLNLPAFMKAHISEDVCRDFEIHGMKFFKADGRKLFTRMVELARTGITIYPEYLYEKDRSSRKARQGRV